MTTSLYNKNSRLEKEPAMIFCKHLLLVIALMGCGPLVGEELKELYADGSVFRKYNISDEGRMHGSFIEYHPSGKVAVKTQYVNGNLHGKYVVADRYGRVARTSVYLHGVLAYPMAVPEIKRGLDKLAFSLPSLTFLEKAQLTAPHRPGRLSGAYLKAALLHVQAYRFLSNVPYRDVKLKVDYIDAAQYGAALLAVLKRLDHTPAKPAGMDQAFFKKAYQGTSRGNLYGGGGLIPSIDAFMDDSDPSNIQHLGHRRWVLNPAMAFTGFGEANGYAVLYAHDGSRKAVPDYDFIPFPPRGYLPRRYFSETHAWHVSLHPKKFHTPTMSDVTITVTPMTSSLKKTGKPLRLDQTYLSTVGYGIPLCLIFKPSYQSGLFGQPFWVEVRGLKRKDDGDPLVQYLVHVY